MIKEFFIHMHGYFAVDYDILSARHWWDNNLANSTLDTLKELANIKYLIKESIIKETCIQEPNKLNSLLGLHNEMKTLTENMMSLGKVILHEEFLNNTTIVEKLNSEYVEMENKALQIHAALENQLENCRIPQVLRDSRVLEDLKKGESLVIDEVRKLWENNIYSEVKATLSPSIATSSPSPSIATSSHSPLLFRTSISPSPISHSTSLSPSPIPHSTSLSPILEELKKLPTISR
jgi:hypothetical protein